MSEKNKKDFKEPSIDVSELSQTLYDTNIKLSESIKERNEMFANISHDLRAPITAIHNCIEYLQSLDKISEADIREVLPMLESRSAMLERMIEDIFLLTKLDFSGDIFHFESVPANAFFEDIYYIYRADEQYSSRKLSLDVTSEPDTFINIDVHYMKRAIDNIFKNALKYTKKDDFIKLALADSGDKLEIIISNNGDSISSDILPHIFDRTFTASESRTPAENNGLGLGLSICKTIIEKHDGEIYAVSDAQSGKGCEFHILLPKSVC